MHPLVLRFLLESGAVMKLSIIDSRLPDGYANKHQVFFEELFKRQDELESKDKFSKQEKHPEVILKMKG